jgi:helitron helicase-like protein
MVDEHNSLAKAFRMARDRFDCEGRNENVKLKLIGKRSTDGRTYNLPTSNEVAALIVGDIGNCTEDRDIVIEKQNGQLQRINELHPSYLALQYPFLFPYGEDGYRLGILQSSNSSGSRAKVSMREWFAYRIQERDGEPSTILSSRKLFQQFLVDAYTMVESERLCYIRTHQKDLRADLYKNLKEVILRDNESSSSTGKRIVMPSSFTGGARYMIQNYQDAMAICRWYGYPDLFITFTCNSRWPEIQDTYKKGDSIPKIDQTYYVGFSKSNSTN